MKRFVARALRIGAVGLAALGLLYLRFSMGVWPENEVSRVVHWGLLPIAFLLGFGAWAMEMSESSTVSRRDVLWAVSGALVTFSVLRLTGQA